MDRKLQKILKGVSRSFYVSLLLLPEPIRKTIGLAFLFCKAADTIADTDLLPVEKRLSVLHAYRDVFLRGFPFHGEVHLFYRGGSASERQLLMAIPDLFTALEALPPEDNRHVRWLLPLLTEGMIFDLTFFSSDKNHLKALSNRIALEDYTYAVAGCVGRFWTRILKSHYPFAATWSHEVEDLGEIFGKGLQMVNILRDLPRDVQNGRCYLPFDELKQENISLGNLIDINARNSVKLFLRRYLEEAHQKLSAASKYVSFFPEHERRLRAAVLLPMKLGHQTLDQLEASPHWPDAHHVIKVPRWKVYTSLLHSLIFS